MVNDAAEKWDAEWAADAKLVAKKTVTKVQTEAELVKATDGKMGMEKELRATKQYIMEFLNESD